KVGGITASLTEARVDVVVVPSGGAAHVVDACAGVSPTPVACVVVDARVPVAALPDQVLDLQRTGVGAQPVGDLPTVVQLGARRERPGPGHHEVAGLAPGVIARRVPGVAVPASCG